jgi:general secretion pathway protein K
MKHHPPNHEQGAALLTVLLLVAVMAVISATAIERLTLATRLAASAGAIEQARHYQLAAEALAIRRIEQLVRGKNQVTLEGDWLGKPFLLPLPGGGSAELTLTDGGNCFNLNSLVADPTVSGSAPRPLAMEQFSRLMTALSINSNDAQRIAASTTDWIDADQDPATLGAEDNVYAGAPSPYRAADRTMTDAAELRSVAGVGPQQWARLQPWICALPTSDLSPINVNTLLPEQAPLLTMLVAQGLSPAQARAHLASRPTGGYGSISRFWNGPILADRQPGSDTATQVKLMTRWFRLRTKVRIGNSLTVMDTLIDAGTPDSSARVVRRLDRIDE